MKSLLISYAICLVVAVFLYPSMTAHYDAWYSAIWNGSVDGALGFENWILSHVLPNHPYRSPMGGDVYNVTWWISVLACNGGHIAIAAAD
jgi:hypothetical protein